MVKSVIRSASSAQKSFIVAGFDLAICVLTLFASFYLRIEKFVFLSHSWMWLISVFLVVPLAQLACFYFMGLYRGVWRFSSTPDLLRVIKGVSLAVPVSFAALFLLNRLEGIPRSLFIIQWAFLIVGIGGSRFAYRLYRDNFLRIGKSINDRMKVLIVGAGYAGEQLLRDIKNDDRSDYHVVGFIDDDYGKRRKIIHGVSVLGNTSDISQIAKEVKAKLIIIAVPSATKEQMSRIVAACNSTNLQVRTIPRLGDLISGKLRITKLRKVTPEDLLGRDQVELNMQSMAHMITDKVVFVSGAGGSIGSELCIQIAKFKPKRLVCCDFSELNMYALGFKLERFKEFTQTEFIVGDVRDRKKMSSLFDRHRPELVFHAAAYKHVPMMEMNPQESVSVNVQGTKNIVELADEYKVERFVLVSTDKAVNPTNVMGTTKRVAEMICQCQQEKSKTKFVVVRFGNVLGSSGSVIPLFQKQIEKGGPITVTHPDIERYFMSIPEAAQLVIQAGSIGNGGEVFVLDMGEPVKIVDLAKQMITLAGLKLNEDIEIEFTGLRPGEKLFEELLADEETTLATQHERVRVAKVRPACKNFDSLLTELIDESNETNIRARLKYLVPEYATPEESSSELSDAKIIELH